MLSVMLKIFSFNPLSGAYLTVFFGTITVFLMYILGSQIFSRKVGIIACFLYMASPLIVQFDRMPYHTSPIPFFTLLYFFCFYKWLSGSTKYFPMILLSLAILYNLELATCVLVFPFALVFAYGCLKNKKWIKELLNRKIISFSLILPILIMFPVIIYDFSHGFKQTVVFLGWIIYKPFSFSISHSNVNFSSTFSSIVTFIAVSLQKLVFEQSLIISLLISFLSIIIIAKRIKIDHSISKMLLLFLLLISVGGIIVSQTPSDAYLPVIFPFAIFSIAILFDRLLKIQYLKYLAPALLLVILLANFYSSFNQDRNIMGLGSVMITVNRIIALSSGREYNLVGEGKDSQFSSFTMNYEYLLWWRGYAPSHKNVNLKIFVSESPVGYIVRKNND
jgi:4-amino-4-deoxy-L-arabinose transferase-like glycosyltransferase